MKERKKGYQMFTKFRLHVYKFRLQLDVAQAVGHKESEESSDSTPKKATQRVFVSALSSLQSGRLCVYEHDLRSNMQAGELQDEWEDQKLHLDFLIVTCFLLRVPGFRCSISLSALLGAKAMSAGLPSGL